MTREGVSGILDAVRGDLTKEVYDAEMKRLSGSILDLAPTCICECGEAVYVKGEEWNWTGANYTHRHDHPLRIVLVRNSVEVEKAMSDMRELWLRWTGGMT